MLNLYLPAGEELGTARREFLEAVAAASAGALAGLIDRARAEEARQRMVVAERLEAMGRLAGGVAHDFNNLLAVIIMHAELAMSEPGASCASAEDLGVVLEAAQKAANLTRQLLTISRHESVEPHELDLNEQVSNMLRLLRRTLGEDIIIIDDLGEDLERVVADPGALEQVILNLTVNARDAMPEGGELQIGTRNRLLDSPLDDLPAGRYLELTVADTGCGIPPQVVDHIFEPFFTTKGSSQGTGLGLATVYGFVKQAGGGIQVDSWPGRGTRFTTLLPATSMAAAADEAIAHNEARPGRETVLLVDDDERLLNVTRRVLERAGYSVHAATSAASALEQARTIDSLDLLLTDVVMPGTSGVELAGLLKPARVLFMSGFPDDHLSRYGTPGAHDSYLAKPFNSRELLVKVEEVLAAP